MNVDSLVEKRSFFVTQFLLVVTKESLRPVQ